jgi:hypothetical protein
MYISSSISYREKVAVLHLAILGSVILLSCNSDDSTQLSDPSNSKRRLEFKVNLKGSWEKTRKSAISRGIPYNELAESFGVFASHYTLGEELNQTMNYMWDIESCEYMEKWQTYTSFTMPPVNKGMSFYAYYPYQSDEITPKYITFNGGDEDRVGAPYFDFSIPDDIPQQVDLMVASGQMNSTNLIAGNPIELRFSHLLTAIRFVVDESVPQGYINSISINNVSSGGTYYYNGTTAWQTVNDDQKTFTLTTSLKTGICSSISLEDDEAFLMMPQYLGNEASVTVVFDNGKQYTFTTSLAEKEWQAGKIVTYNIIINSLNSMSLKASIEDWKVGDTFNWTSQN